MTNTKHQHHHTQKEEEAEDTTMTAKISRSKHKVDFNSHFFTVEKEEILRDNTAVCVPSQTHREGIPTDKYVPKINKTVAIKGGQAELVKCTFVSKRKKNVKVFYILTGVCQLHMGDCTCAIDSALFIHRAHASSSLSKDKRYKQFCKRSLEIASAGKLVKTERLITREVWKVQSPTVQRIEVYGFVNEDNEKLLKEKHKEIVNSNPNNSNSNPNNSSTKKLKEEYAVLLREVEGTINIDPFNFPDARQLIYTGDLHPHNNARLRNKNSVFYPNNSIGV